jgi:hypothetical protein
MLFTPEQLNSKIGVHFEEKALLLVREVDNIYPIAFADWHAIYAIDWKGRSLDRGSFTDHQSYDYTLEKVKIYARVPLGYL